MPITILMPVKELPKFGEIQLFQQSCAVLDITDYKKGDEIYLELIFLFSSDLRYHENEFLTELTLDVWENDIIEYIDR